MVDKAYFDAVAQLIPLLLLVTVVEGRLGRGMVLTWPVPAAVLALLVGEAATLSALAASEPTKFHLLVATYGLCLGVFALGVELTIRYWRPLGERPRRGTEWRWIRDNRSVVAALMLSQLIIFSPIVAALWVTVATLV
jgi:hypothetical protein